MAISWEANASETVEVQVRIIGSERLEILSIIHAHQRASVGVEAVCPLWTASRAAAAHGGRRACFQSKTHQSNQTSSGVESLPLARKRRAN
ncbi:hypothetical protein EVAR_87663_1 [Eumeta japonica]|uniref:Uncharacterized protein n=1 Tax=Eumeta variegata TaxID=151549 RepID=A0A4C1WI17_EUMVA|nr:hypothetical protein EVAR_87663_1 [Eumeta japonica]